MWRVVNQNSYLNTFVHLVVKQTPYRRQLVKVEEVIRFFMGSFCKHQRPPCKTVNKGRRLTKVVLWAFSLGTAFPLLDLGMNTQFQRLPFPDSGKDT